MDKMVKKQIKRSQMGCEHSLVLNLRSIVKCLICTLKIHMEFNCCAHTVQKVGYCKRISFIHATTLP